MKHKSISQTFTSKEHLRKSMTRRIEKIVSEAVKKRGQALMALSGGNTPKGLFEYLSKSDLPWDKVVITLVDERWVETDHAQSNEYLIRHSLMQDKASRAQFIGLKNEEDSALKGVEICQQRLQVFKDDFDLVILGMGEDGHTASFFPEAKELESALSSDASCVSITPPSAEYNRMTLTLSRLLRSKNIFLHIEGSPKFKVLHEAFEEGSVEQMPIRAFIHKETRPYLEVFYAK